MNLEKGKVKRRDIIRNIRHKEWWYTGCYDGTQNVYLSFFFCRVPFIDSFNFALFDLTQNEPFVYNKKLFLDKPQNGRQLDLCKESKELSLQYKGDGEKGWHFELEHKKVSVSLEIIPTAPRFTKFDNYFINQYSLLHYMHNRVNGHVRVEDKIYKINHALGYYDHCYGKVPRKTMWNWIAVQNEEIALVSLVNYGTCPQKYTQILIRRSGFEEKWIRLNQEVSFEYLPESKDTYWKITSCDMELEVNILMASKSKEKIPSWTPFIVNLQHNELFVEVKGRVKYLEKWLDTGFMYGVMEEHFGTW